MSRNQQLTVLKVDHVPEFRSDDLEVALNLSSFWTIWVYCGCSFLSYLAIILSVLFFDEHMREAIRFELSNYYNPWMGFIR